jgi:predicted RNase H-like HicB family nuclease
MTDPHYPPADHYSYRVLHEDGVFVARCAEFPALSWAAPTPEDARTGLVKLVESTLRDLVASGGDVPRPEIPFSPPVPQHHFPPTPMYAPPTAAFPMQQMPYYPQPQMMQNVVVNASARVNGYRGVNHGFHALMTLLTCGLWAPIWIIVAVAGGRR